MKKASLMLLLAAVLAWSTGARAAQALDAASLARYCAAVEAAPDSAEARLCTLYVTGFLDGAVATDARVAENVADEIERSESFSERAIRTRVIRRLEIAGPTGYAEFCVGEPVPIGDVVRHVVAELGRNVELEGRAAQDIVYAALRQQYPCQAVD